MPNPQRSADGRIAADFEGIRQEFGFPGDDPTVMKCLLLWAALVGAISLEVFGQYGADTFSDVAVEGEVGLMIDLFTR